MTHPLAEAMYDHDDLQGQARAKQEQDEANREVYYGGFVKFESKGDRRSQKVTPFDRHAPKPWYLGKLRYKGYWRAQGYAQRGWSQYSQSLTVLANYLHKNGIAQPAGVFLDAGCGDSPDALLAVKDLGYRKALKIDLFELSFDEYGCAKLYYSDTPIRGTIENMEKDADIHFIKNDLCQELPIEDKSIDAISCNAVLDLMLEDDRLLFYQQAYRILKPGGLFIGGIVPLAAGYGINGRVEANRCGMAGLTIIRCSGSMFIVRKPWPRNSRGQFRGDP